MKDKVTFSEFLIEKRKASNLTQKELANRLFVSDTAVSKWERGISYPDITLISRICEELHITEHEFVTACDDVSAKEEKVQAKRYRGFLKAYNWTLIISYSIALLTSFICNLAINHTLSWFFILLASLALAFSITSLPIILKKQKMLITFSVATVLIYMLLFVCSIYSSGDWLLTIAYPLATVSILAVWLIMLTIKYIRANWLIKSGIVSLILSALSITINPFYGYLRGDISVTISDYFNLTDLQHDLGGNQIAFLGLAVLGVIGIIAGIIKAIARNYKGTK